MNLRDLLRAPHITPSCVVTQMSSYSGDRIRQARVIRFRTSKELADQLGWSPPRLTKVERADAVEVTFAEAKRLQTYLGFSDEFFRTEPDPLVTEADLLFRAPRRTTKREKSYLAEFARLVQRLIAQLDARHRLPSVRLPSEIFRIDELPALANAARKTLQLEPDQPIGHLTHSLERAGVVIVVRPTGLSPDDERRFDDGSGNRFSEVHHGYSTWVGMFRERPLIVMRASTSWERTRWTVSHELGHLLLHRTDLPNSAEEDASRFASELLAPLRAVAPEIPIPATLAGLVPIKKKWGISLGALLPHLRDGGVITEARFQALRTQLYTRRNPETGRTWGLDEPGWNERKPERPRLLSAWIERDLGTTDPEAVSSMLPFFPADVLAQILREQRHPGSARAGWQASGRQGEIAEVRSLFGGRSEGGRDSK